MFLLANNDANNDDKTPKRTITKILRRANIKCSICGWNESTCDIHHIIHKKDGGSDNMDNLIVVCPNCYYFLGGSFLVNNPGKKWEQNFKENALKQDLFIIRFNDSDLSFNENKDLRSKFTPKSPADFMIY